MPSWTHLGLGVGLLALLIAGAVNAFPAKPAGGGENLRVIDVDVEGRRYKVIDRGFGTFEVLSPDDPNAWVIFDASIPGKEVDVISEGPSTGQLRADLPKFPKEVARMFKAAEGQAGR
jgi:hypothetical protein